MIHMHIYTDNTFTLDDMDMCIVEMYKYLQGHILSRCIYRGRS